MKTTVKIQESIYIIHSWPGCTVIEVDFLRNKHTHQMFVIVEVSVNHSDRAVEFFVLRKDVLDLLYRYPLTSAYVYNIGNQSMEMVAQELFNKLTEVGYSVESVECSEDGNFSGKVTRD